MSSTNDLEQTANNKPADERSAIANHAVEAAVRIGLIAILVFWCYYIAAPFIIPTIWGIIIAIAVYPGYDWLQSKLGARRKLTAVALTVITLVLIIVPVALLTKALAGNVQDLAEALGDGRLVIPAPPANVAEWPIIGTPIDAFWQRASTNLQSVLNTLQPQLKALGLWLLGLAAGAGFGVLMMIFAIVIAGVLLVFADNGHAAAQALARRLAGERGQQFVELGEQTVRGVSRGILGTAVIQALLAGIGLFFAGIPAAALLTLICLLLCVVQVGPGLVLLPSVIWVFYSGDTLIGVLFLAWSVFVAISDNFLKPYLLAGSIDVPLLVVLIGVIGGMLAHGLIGIFVGPIVMALAWKLLVAWVSEAQPSSRDQI